MPFPTKSEPNIVKETPETKTEPVVQPVNADIDKSLLGKGLEDTPKAQNTTTLGLKQGAGRVNTSIVPKEHVVSVSDFSKNDTRKYNALVHCDTCGWEGRYSDAKLANTAAQNHRDRYKHAA